MEIKLNAQKAIKLEIPAEKHAEKADKQVQTERPYATATQCAKFTQKRIAVLRCGTVMLQNFTEDLNETGRQLKLIREPDNKYDRWAIKVCTLEGVMLGYLPAKKNQSVARLMDAGKAIMVFIDEEIQSSPQPYNYENEKLSLILYMDVNIPKEEYK